MDAQTHAVVIPLACIIQAARGAMVYAVMDGKAVSKPVEVINTYQGLASVKGLAIGERVVLDGRQNVRPDSPVIERGANKAGEKAAEKAIENPTDKNPMMKPTTEKQGGHHRHKPE